MDKRTHALGGIIKNVGDEHFDPADPIEVNLHISSRVEVFYDLLKTEVCVEPAWNAEEIQPWSHRNSGFYGVLTSVSAFQDWDENSSTYIVRWMINITEELSNQSLQ